MELGTIFSVVGVTAVVVSAGAWFMRLFTSHLFNRELESYKADVKTAHDREILGLTHRYQLQQQEYRSELDSRSEVALADLRHRYEQQLESYRSQLHVKTLSSERIREEILFWANPILSSVIVLRKRLQNILSDFAYRALDPDEKDNLPPGWSISYEYFMPSALYAFASYFCWIRMLEQHLSFELFRTQKEKDDFFSGIQAVRSGLSGWPPNKYQCQPADTDRQVFAMEQQAIGEALMVASDGPPTCMTYDDFLGKWKDRRLSQRLFPLIELVDKVSPSDDCRWKRLTSVESALGEFQSKVEDMLKLGSKPIEKPRG